MKKSVRKKSITLESFFKKNFKKEFFPKYVNSFELFCNYLKKNKILNARKKGISPSLRTIYNGYMTEARSVVVSTKENCFKNYICEFLKKDRLYTWQQLREKTKIKIPAPAKRKRGKLMKRNFVVLSLFHTVYV